MMTLSVSDEIQITDVASEGWSDAAEGNGLQKVANERKRRLRQMREQMQQRNDDAECVPSSKLSKLTFRSYEPQNDGLGDKHANIDLFAVEKEIADQLADTEDTTTVEQVDITTLAPRKVDWDLKRDVAERLGKLERQTERAIAQLIRERLKRGKAELCDAVNAGAYKEFQTDD